MAWRLIIVRRAGLQAARPSFVPASPHGGAVVAEPGQLTTCNGDALVALAASPSSCEERIPGLVLTRKLR